MGKTIYTGEPTGPVPKRYLVKYEYPISMRDELGLWYGDREFHTKFFATGEARRLQGQGARVEVIDTWA